MALVAVPVVDLPAVVREVLSAAPEGCAVTDVGSTKGPVCAAAGGDARFVGGHPICGAETRGPERATAELFDGATWFLTPLAATGPTGYREVHGLVAALGARPVAIDPAAHDRLVAVTSHLPHALANLLVNQAGASRVEGHEPLATAGGSLRDMTRIAGANPRIWVDIFLDNREELAAALAEHRRRVEQVEGALASGDAAFSPGGSARRAATGAACSRPRTTTPGRCSDSVSTCPTGRACSPASSRRSEPSGSTWRTSTSTTGRTSWAATSRSSSPARRTPHVRRRCWRRRATASSWRR